MASKTTPKKRVPVNCFICTERKRHFNVSSYQEGRFISKITHLTGENVHALAECQDLGVCRPCVGKVENLFHFSKILKKAVCDVGTDIGGDTYKRMAVSPVTPKREPVKRLSIRSSKKSLDMAIHHVPQLQIPGSDTVDNASDYSGTDVGVLHLFRLNGSVSNEHSYSVSTEDAVEHSYAQSELVNEPNSRKEIPSSSCLALMSLDKLKEEAYPDKIPDIVNLIFSNQVILHAVQSRLLKDMDADLSALVSRNVALGSVLSKYRSVSSLVEKGSKLLNEIVLEMSERIPFLLDIFTVMVTTGPEPVESKLAPVAAAYAILMYARSDRLSAWHRMTTFISIKGHLDDAALTRFNHLGITQSASTKLLLLEEAGQRMDVGIAMKLAQNPLVKITGDNLDVYIKTGHKSLERANNDLHLFASNIIFSRIVRPGQYSLAKPHCELDDLHPELFFRNEHDNDSLKRSYCVLLGRILMTLQAFAWMRPVVPSHIHHQWQVQMSKQFHVFQLPIQMKNEAKHEDCVDILDGYEEMLQVIFTKAFGTDELLRKLKVIVGGDQLTRVRLEEAKHVRTLATTPKKRFDDLDPFVIELWHTKQDYLEKCYKELFKSSTLRQPGTLYHYKSKLQRTDVSGKVKGSFKSHCEFLMLVGREMIVEQFLEYFGMENRESQPTKNIPEVKQRLAERETVMYEMLEKFIIHFGYLDSSHEESDVISESDGEDSVYNYASNLCHWVLQLMQIEDVVKEGDLVRLVPSLKYLLQFFFSHSRLSKYFVECLDFVLKTEYLLSPMQKLRVLEGAFVNLRGGIGENIEADLVQENAVRNQKDLIRALGANKTDAAIARCTKAADTVAEICRNVDSAVTVKKHSSRHQIPKSEKDEAVVRTSLRQLRPFRKSEGRVCQGMPHVLRSPLKKNNLQDLKYRTNQVISRLYHGQSTVTDGVSDDDE